MRRQQEALQRHMRRGHTKARARAGGAPLSGGSQLEAATGSASASSGSHTGSGGKGPVGATGGAAGPSRARGSGTDSGAPVRSTKPPAVIYDHGWMSFPG